jgi:hypothetical protein
LFLGKAAVEIFRIGNMLVHKDLRLFLCPVLRNLARAPVDLL